MIRADEGTATALMVTEAVAKLSPTPFDSVALRENGPAPLGAVKVTDVPAEALKEPAVLDQE
jgi:hypothetical protein